MITKILTNWVLASLIATGVFMLVIVLSLLIGRGDEGKGRSVVSFCVFIIYLIFILSYVNGC